ncbi:hypothetical protein E0W68_12580 [Flavobacterium salilacus subsp. salilacus]|uniref:hypothetical protein n=1 Tax=Flavobacterium TaxID=237 RepID=UPI0010751AA1|nr:MULTISPECIES: hypothetical protein [Flavobacterium]KAF2515783.1 hypothetical protein E0W68_12580 [Flavobacterium salilacus subsp. salilacus]MBE1615415.1 hypothetical protein [Flavobacterium sp. SaA2.13]
MKNFLLCLSLSVFFMSCSEESNSLESNNNNLNDELKAKSATAIVDLTPLYINMIESSEYKVLTAKNKVFIEKLNFDNSIELKEEEDLINWAETNILRTDFSDLNEFTNSWDEIKSLHAVVYANHKSFYSELFSAYPNINIDLPIDDNDPNANCPCWSQLTLCEHSASQMNTLAIFGSYIISGTTGSSLDTLLALNETVYQSNQNACNDTYVNCMNNCE